MDWDSRDLASLPACALERFKEHTELMLGGPLEKKLEEAKCNCFMLWIGEKGREIFSIWDVSVEDRKCVQTYYNGFEAYCKPKTNTVYNRFFFKSRTQGDSETFDQFVTEVKLLVKDCQYPLDIQDELIRDHIEFGLQSTTIREKLICEGSDLTLQKCLDTARMYELSAQQTKTKESQAAELSGSRKG